MKTITKLNKIKRIEKKENVDQGHDIFIQGSGVKIRKVGKEI